MADLFRDRSCMHWWLPNDEGYPPIIRNIRRFVEERTSPARDVPAEDLRDMKAIFASLNLDDWKSNIPVAMNKGKAPSGSGGWTNPSIGSEHMQGMGGMDIEGGEGYELGFDEGQGSWGEGQGRGVFGIQKPGDFP